MKSTLKTTLIVLFVLNCLAANAQIWTPVAALKTQNKAKQARPTTPTKYQLFSLNSVQLKSILESAPSRASKKTNGSIIELPTANGVIQKFRAQEASVLDSKLAKRFPDIKSYVAYGIDDPTSIARFSISPIGLNAMISSSNHNTILIDPYTKDKKEYICYAKKDSPANPTPFQCLVEKQAKKKILEAPSQNFKNAYDGKMRTYRLALACTGEYAQYHLTEQGVSPSASDAVKKAAVLAAMNTTMTRVNGIYEKEISFTMLLINQTTDIIYLNSSTDPYTNDDVTAMFSENQTTCDAIINDSNYDIGHVFSTANGGLAGFNKCTFGTKAQGTSGRTQPIGDLFDLDLVTHELGHQFGAGHTFNNECALFDKEGNKIINRSDSSAFEPGSGTTLMSYSGRCVPNVQFDTDPYFHSISLEQMFSDHNFSGDCSQERDTGNTAPTADAGLDFTIPASTPFILEGIGSDSDAGNVLTYCWEQMDNEIATMPPLASSTGGPVFRSLPPMASPDRYMPALPTVIAGQTASTWEVVPSVSRTMNFRLTVRDNSPVGGNTASDNTEITVAGAAGPFVVNSPNTTLTWEVGTNETITWNVAGTTGNGINAANVDILLSTDGGFTYPVTIESAIPNDGSQEITVPDNVGTENRIMVRGSDHIFYDISNTNFIIELTTDPDIEPPTDVTDLESSNITLNSFDVSWTASMDNFSVTKYQVFIDGGLQDIIEDLTYSFSGLDSGTTYTISVVALDAAGNESTPAIIEVKTKLSIIDEILEDSNSVNGENNANDNLVTAADLSVGLGMVDVKTQNNIAYQTAIAVEENFSTPPTTEQVQELIDNVNTAESDKALAAVLENSITPGENNPNAIPVTVIQLSVITGIRDVIPVNEAAYQDAIAETSFEIPLTPAQVQKIIDRVNLGDLVIGILDEIFEDSASDGVPGSANDVKVNAQDLIVDLGMENVLVMSDLAYKAAIAEKGDFSDPPTLEEVQELIDAVNTAESDDALVKVFEYSNSPGSGDANGTPVTVRQLAVISGIKDVIPENELAYQATIRAGTNFSNPPKVKEVQDIIDNVNAAAACNCPKISIQILD